VSIDIHHAAGVDYEPEVQAPSDPGEGHDEHPAGGHIHLPPDSIWPITMAFGVTMAASSLVLNWLMVLPGLFFFVWALRGWAGELLHDSH
jgi:hypothetical protein